MRGDGSSGVRQGEPSARTFTWIGYGVACLVAVALSAELLSVVAFGFYYGSYLRSRVIAPELPRPRGDPPAVFSLRSLIHEDFGSASPAYDGFSWAQEHWRELRAAYTHWQARYEPFVVWANSGFHGKYINVDDADHGAWRRTINSCGSSTPPLQIWIFGGSTVFSADNPDFSTIPSFLSKTLNSDPARCVQVTNLGVAGYGTNQEVLLLLQELKSGKRPDIAIFYDGFNEAYVGAFSPGVPAAHHNLAPIKARLESTGWLGDVIRSSYALRAMRMLLEGTGAGALLPYATTRAGQRPLDEAALAAKALSTLDNYEWNIGLVKSLEGRYSFKAHFFWQPTLAYGNKRRTAFEDACLKTPALTPAEQVRAVAAVYREAERRSGGNAGFVNLARLFDQKIETIYIDSIHVGPRGNQLIADEIARRIQ
jgi:hypothetical protein